MQFMLVLNPWGKKCWKGRFSVDDSTSWTPEMKKQLGFNLFKDTDNGIFWILFEDALKAFAHLELNWNPEMLKYN